MLYLTKQEHSLFVFLLFACLGGAVCLALAQASPALARSAAFIARSRAAQAVNINNADYHELVTVSGIGPLTARRILAERRRAGDFASVEELKRVRGMSSKRIRQISGQIRLR